MYAAKKRGLPVVSLVHSWDNIPARGFFSVKPDKLLVWNRSMADQAVSFQNMKYSDIKIVGSPQFEYYRRIGACMQKDQLIERLPLDRGSKIVCYTASAERVFPDEPEFIDELLSVLGRIKSHSVKFILRLHPEERKEYYIAKYSKSDNVILDIPNDGFRATATSNIGTKEDIESFVMLMKYSNIVINLGSTVTLDALLFNTPVICPSFNPILEKEAWNAAHKHYRVTHYEVISASGAVLFPTSVQELERQINFFLDSPLSLSKERKELINRLAPNIETSSLIRDVLSDFSMPGLE